MGKGKVKALFAGNTIAGDDGIGPYLFNVLEKEPRLSAVELIDIGVIGLNLINYVEENDKIIIIDAIRSKGEIGKVAIVNEKELSINNKFVSQHDMGIEQSVGILRNYMPEIDDIKLIGITVNEVKPFTTEISQELMNKIDEIKEEVIRLILLK